jgi:PLD-like domain/Hsp70 protein
MDIAYFSGIRQIILDKLDTAQVDIKVAVAWFTNSQLFEKLCQKRKQGVNVTVIIIDDFINNGDWGLNFQEFINLGGNLYYGNADNPMHHKFCIIDNQILVSGSYNWTYYAENKNVENIVLFENQPILVQQFRIEFESLCSKLSKMSFAIKRKFEDSSMVDLFSTKNYLAFDLYHHGKQENKKVYFEAATRVLPVNTFLAAEYQKVNEELIVKKTITALGIESRRDGILGRFWIIIDKGVVVPYAKSHTFWTILDNQTTMTIKTFKGENDYCNLNHNIGEFLIADLPPKKAGSVGASIHFSLDKNGQLTVKAKSLDTGNEISATYDIGQLVF